MKLFDQWAKIESRLKPNVQTIICLADNDAKITPEYQKFFEGSHVVVVRREHFFERYNVRIFPTVLGVDHYGLVVHIQYYF